MKRIAKRLVIVLLLIGMAAVGLAMWGGPLADIRPAVITLEPQPDREARGRALIEAALVAQGEGDGLAGYKTRSFRMEDEWRGAAAALFSPWPDPIVEARVVQRRHSFDSTVTFVSGKRAGDTWGVVDAYAWERSGSGKATPTDNPGLTFMLPTLHYFVEFALRFPEAEIIRYVGSESIRGVEYQVVFLTWGSTNASERYDQYLVYVDPKTSRIAKVYYTVRDAMKFITGAGHLLEQKPVGGIWMATRIPVTQKPTDDPAEFIHEFRFSDIVFDADEL